MSLKVIGIKTLLVMMTDLLLAAVAGFAGILSALAFDKEPWGQGFWMWSVAVIAANTVIGTISWWAWCQLRYRTK